MGGQADWYVFHCSQKKADDWKAPGVPLFSIFPCKKPFSSFETPLSQKHFLNLQILCPFEAPVLARGSKPVFSESFCMWKPHVSYFASSSPANLQSTCQLTPAKTCPADSKLTGLSGAQLATFQKGLTDCKLWIQTWHSLIVGRFCKTCNTVTCNANFYFDCCNCICIPTTGNCIRIVWLWRVNVQL